MAQYYHTIKKAHWDRLLSQMRTSESESAFLAMCLFLIFLGQGIPSHAHPDIIPPALEQGGWYFKSNLIEPEFVVVSFLCLFRSSWYCWVSLLQLDACGNSYLRLAHEKHQGFCENAHIELLQVKAPSSFLFEMSWLSRQYEQLPKPGDCYWASEKRSLVAVEEEEDY